jgi:hypothetical protein
MAEGVARHFISQFIASEQLQHFRLPYIVISLSLYMLGKFLSNIVNGLHQSFSVRTSESIFFLARFLSAFICIKSKTAI